LANHKSAEKRAVQNEKKRVANKIKKSAAKTAVKKVRDSIASNDVAAAKALLIEAQSKLAKLAKSSAMKKQTASRKISRIALQVAQLEKTK
jgi:small subunit ribosomal protein S20